MSYHGGLTCLGGCTCGGTCGGAGSCGVGSIDRIAAVSPFDVRPVLAPEARPMGDSLPGAILEILLALTPAMIVGAFAGATLASYDEKQKSWAIYGATAAAGVAGVALFLNAARPR